MESHLHGLNPAQREAVAHTGAPLLVLAGAGSGKTRVITHRIVRLIEEGVTPGHILAVTFTNKAAREMRERAAAACAARPSAAASARDGAPTIATFHSLSVRILREHAERLGIKRHFTILDQQDATKLIKRALTDRGYDTKEFEPRRILSMISKVKGDARTRAEYASETDSPIASVVGEVWQRYEVLQHEASALDFDDLLGKTFSLLKSHPEVLADYRSRYRHIHIDEYQDTNRVQYEIVRLLAGGGENLCVVGDIDQSIYSWRNARIENILQFERHFPGAKTIMLEENYRSTQAIVTAANDVIAKNKNRPPKTCFTKNAEGEPIALYAAMNARDEAEYVAETARQLIADGASPSAIGVLFRMNFQSRALEEAFLRSDVPYQVLGTRFFDRAEVKDMLAYLRLALGGEGTADLSRVMNVPPRGIGKVTLMKVLEGREEQISGKLAERVGEFRRLIHELAAYTKGHTLRETLEHILKTTGIEAHLRDEGEEGGERLQNIFELISLSERYDAEHDPNIAAERLLDDAALESDQDNLKKKEEQDAVRLMTVHASKGLEFPYVFVTGMEEGIFPHERFDGKDDERDAEEERRLFYVALTRGGTRVFLTFAHLRTIFGADHVNEPSSFLDDIRAELIKPVNDGMPRGSGFGEGGDDGGGLLGNFFGTERIIE